MAQINISRHIAAIRSAAFPQSNFLALALQQIQDAINNASASASSFENATVAASSSAPAALAQAAVAPSSANVIGGVQGGQVTAASIAPNAVTTGAIAANAVSVEVSQLQASVAIGTAPSQVASVSLGTGGGAVILSASAQLNNAGASGQVVRVQIYKGDNTGTLLLDTGASGIPVAAGGCVPWGSGLLFDSAPGATQQYTVYGSIAAGSGSAVNLLLTAINLKR